MAFTAIIINIEYIMTLPCVYMLGALKLKVNLIFWIDCTVNYIYLRNAVYEPVLAQSIRSADKVSVVLFEIQHQWVFTRILDL